MELDGYVANLFKIAPLNSSTTVYCKGMSERDLNLGECREEQAWVIEFVYAGNHTVSKNLQLTCIYLRPGVSRKEAKKAVDQAFTKFPSRGKSNRPPMREIHRQFLRTIFERAYAHNKEIKPVEMVKLIIKIDSLLKDYGLDAAIGKDKISKELRAWRNEKNLPVKHYCLDRKRGQVHKVK